MQESHDSNLNSHPQEVPHADANRTNIFRKAFSLILHQWLIIGIGAVCVLAYYFPNVAKTGGTIRSEYSIFYGAVAIIFLISGLSISQKSLSVHFLNWRLHLVVQVISFLLTPAIMLAVVHTILVSDTKGSIDRAILAGYILTACIPTTIASNVVMTNSAGGDDAAALVEVLIANLLGPFVAAGWTITLLPKTPEFDVWRNNSGGLSQVYQDVFKQLGLSVLLPLVIGQMIRWSWPTQVNHAILRFRMSKVATACLLLLIW